MGKQNLQIVQGLTGPQGYRQQVLERATHGVFDRQYIGICYYVRK